MSAHSRLPLPTRHVKLVLVKDGMLGCGKWRLASPHPRIKRHCRCRARNQQHRAFLTEANAEAIAAAISETIQPPTRGYSGFEPPRNRGRSGHRDSFISSPSPAPSANAARHSIVHAGAVRALPLLATPESTHLCMNKQSNLAINGKGGLAAPSVSGSAPSSRTNKA